MSQNRPDPVLNKSQINPKNEYKFYEKMNPLHYIAI